ncbi:Homocysteine-responsive endoplasmic reticulum-resident ubiquitin-like domain member 2 protein [Trichoplax sp. H2]|nr:Homocysteine-responsive endoplasmic reticulum-resident ubiquitin-like domain member 2 protein [Trichoplax sp. H2]|eukprot:RDD41194.1 Homocysteine-responsive endoplasmic reticulum-resident ubiquitin-like domain member 2 protein [Trichoplax sp. H2]
MAAASGMENDKVHNNSQTPVTLIIKTPNQKIKDIVVDCYLEWSVKELKQLLSSLYPTQPLPDTQKLIYGGKLLRDGDTLTQALRQFKVGEKPIIHMVCSTLLTTDQKKNQKEIETSTEQQPTETPSQLSLPTTANENQTISNDSLPTTANENQTISNASLPTTANESQTTSSDGLRNRMPGTNFPPQFPFASGTLGNWQFPSPVDNQPVIRPAEVAHAAAAAASSAYWSYYYWYMYYNTVGNNRPSNVRSANGYFNGINAGGQGENVADEGQRSTPTNDTNNDNSNVNNNGNNNNNNNVNNAANDNVAMNVAAGIFDDEEQDLMANDWLSYIYGFFRVGLVLIVLWFHSTPLLFGIMLAIIPKWIPNNTTTPHKKTDAENVRNEGEQNLADNNSDARENESGDVNNANVNQELEPESPPSFMFVARSFIVSFFTSLIPQNPEAA